MVAGPDPVITSPTALPDGSPLAPYSYQLAVVGGAGTWSKVSGGPGAGWISVSSSGKVTGTGPLLGGNFTFRARFTETATGRTVEKDFTIKVS